MVLAILQHNGHISSLECILTSDDLTSPQNKSPGFGPRVMPVRLESRMDRFAGFENAQRHFNAQKSVKPGVLLSKGIFTGFGIICLKMLHFLG